MNHLGQIAAIATVVACVFTVATYFDTAPTSTTTYLYQADPPHQSYEPVLEPNPTKKTPAAPVVIQEQDGSRDPYRAQFEAALKIPSTTSRSNALSNLARKAVNAGYFSSAFEFADNIPSTTSRSDTMRFVALKVASSGNLPFAVQVADRIPSTTTKSKTLAEISGL